MFGYSMSLGFLLLSIASLAASQLLTKWRFASIGFDGSGLASQRGLLLGALSDPWLWLAGGLIIIGATFWYLAMTRLPLTLMLPLAGCITPVVALFSYMLLKEPLTSGQFGAILVIASGVVWLGLQQ